MVRTTVVFLGILLGIAVIAAGCSSEKAVKEETVEERFAHAKELFDKEDYLEAINEFTVVTLQYQGSAFAGDAQYYLGECRFHRGEYLLASFEYSVLRRNYPASPRVPEAQYKLALSYYMLSPRPSLDPQYTRKAIDEFQTFVEYYPTNSLVADATAKIKELTNRLAQKQYDTARLYVKMDYYRAALIYLNDVIERYHDTEYAPLAFLDKADLLISHRHYKEAGDAVDLFIARYPNSVLRARADALKRTAERELQANPPVSGTDKTKPAPQAQNGQM